MCIQDHCDVQDDEEWQTQDEMPFPGLVANDVHGNQSANGAANEAEPKQARLRGTPPVVVAALCDMLIPDKRDEGDDVNHSQVDAHDPQLAQVPAREDATDARVKRYEPEFCGDYKPPYDKTDDGKKPPRDVVLVHTVSTAETTPYKQREQHADRASRNRKQVENQRVRRRTIKLGNNHAEEKVNGER